MTTNTLEFASFTYPKKLGDLPKTPLNKRLESYKANHNKTASGYFQDKPGVNVDGRMFYLESDFMPDLRFKYCDEVAKMIGHTGWFTDEYGISDKIRGIVMRLPHDKGFLAGWTMGIGMISEVEYKIYDNENDCAYAADSMARIVAEKEQEAEAQYQLDNAGDNE